MTSLRNKPSAAESTTDLALDAAREAILAVGWSRTTLTDIARRAGVSRMTLYRRWPEMSELLGDLMTREWEGLVDVTAWSGSPADIADSVVATVSALRGNELFNRIIDVDPEIVLPYLLQRSGRSQKVIVDLLAGAISIGQREGLVRPGEPILFARSILLAAHGCTLSAQTMTSRGRIRVRTDDLAAELRTMVERYLAP